MLLHINPTRQRGKRTGSLARASGWYMTFFAAGVIGISLIGSWLACPKSRSIQRLTCLVQDGETRSAWGRVEIADLGQSIKMIARVSFRFDVPSVVRWTS